MGSDRSWALALLTTEQSLIITLQAVTANERYTPIALPVQSMGREIW